MVAFTKPFAIAMLLSTAHSQLWGEDPLDPPYFVAELWGHDGVDCTTFARGDNRRVIGEGKCENWSHGQTFKSFGYGWLTGTPLQDPSVYGSCVLSVYEGAHCTGECIGEVEQVSGLTIVWEQPVRAPNNSSVPGKYSSE